MLQDRNKQVVAYIGLGSNLDQPQQQIKAARHAIAQLESVLETAFSGFYSSPPMGPQDQPDYVNAVMAIKTDIAALDLLAMLQTIETQQGRVRGERWGARTLDLDVLLYGDQQINVPELLVPHIGISERAFVLYPLLEIAPHLIIPGLGRVSELAEKCPRDGLSLMSG